jgi:hypothetical protein
VANDRDEAQSRRSIGWPYMAACRDQGPLLNRNAMADRPDAGVLTNGHKVPHMILDVFPLSYQNTKNHPINAIKLSQLTVPLGYTLAGPAIISKNSSMTTRERHHPIMCPQKR